jgi:hypothetical protein
LFLLLRLLLVLLLLLLLCRLPRLSCLDLHATTAAASSAPLMTLALEVLQLRLPNLRHLAVSIMGGWGDSAQPFKAIGAASQLTRLELYSYTDVPAQITMGHLSALSGLSSSLRALVLGIDQLSEPDGQQQQQDQDFGFLSALTGLTQLMLPLPSSAVNLTAVSACTSLRNLSLSAIEEQGFVAELEEEDCKALGCLVQLTELRLPKVQGTGSSAVFLSALRQLQELRILRVDELVPATALPVLAQLPKLAEMGCIWGTDGDAEQQARPVAAAAVLPEQQLPELHSMGAAGHAQVPWAAFPQLLTVMQWDQWSTENFAGICRHCTQVRELASCEWRAETTSLPPETPAAQRAAAVAGLAKLPHLELLHFSANDDAEIAALAAASQLQQLTLMVPDGNLDTKACR